MKSSAIEGCVKANYVMAAVSAARLAGAASRLRRRKSYASLTVAKCNGRLRRILGGLSPEIENDYG
jgi:hypothetical protein